MKKLFLFLIPALFFGVSCKDKGTKEETKDDNTIEYSKEVKPLEYGQIKFKSFQLANKGNVTAEMVKGKMGEVLGILKTKNLRFRPDSLLEKESRYIGFRRADDPSGVFEMNRITGRIIYNKGLKEYQSDASTDGLPGEDEAVRLTKMYFTQMKLVDNEKELSKPMISGLEMSSKIGEAKPQIYKKMVTVRFNRVLDGLPVEGATRLVFSYGKNAELTSMIADWGKWQAQDLGADQIMQPKEIMESIERKLLGESKGAQKITVTQRDVVLYDDGQGSIEPAVYVKAILKYSRKTGKDGQQEFEIPLDFYQPLMSKSMASFPHVKDQNLRVQPKENTKQANDTMRKQDDE